MRRRRTVVEAAECVAASKIYAQARFREEFVSGSHVEYDGGV